VLCGAQQVEGFKLLLLPQAGSLCPGHQCAGIKPHRVIGCGRPASVARGSPGRSVCRIVLPTIYQVTGRSSVKVSLILGPNLRPRLCESEGTGSLGYLRGIRVHGFESSQRSESNETFKFKFNFELEVRSRSRSRCHRDTVTCSTVTAFFQMTNFELCHESEILPILPAIRKACPT
jgi:hypothetical protein